MLGKQLCKDPFHSTHYRKLQLRNIVNKNAERVGCSSTSGPGTGYGGLLEKLLQTLQQAEQLLSSQCNLVDDLRGQLAEAQGGHAAALQKLGVMPESQLSAMQQQHTADMLHAVAEFMRHGVEHGAHYASSPEDGLAAIQRRHTVELINGLTHYLQKDVQQMQQMCELIAAKRLPYRRRKDV